MQGMHAEVNKKFAKSVTNYVMTSRIVQGQQDFAGATQGEKADILARWHDLKWDLRHFYVLKRKESTAGKAPAVSAVPTASESSSSRAKSSWLHSRQLSFEERKRSRAERKATSLELPTRSDDGARRSFSDDGEYEQAIQASVHETSRGNAEEDAMIEAAIRESVRAMRARGAILDTLREADELPEKDLSIFDDEEYQITDEEYQSLIERAIQDSMANQLGDVYQPQESGIVGEEMCSAEQASEPTPPGYDDSELQRAIEESRNAPPPVPRDDEAALQQALEASRQEMTREQTEEDMVLEFVKKQSLAEAEIRRQMGKGKGRATPQEPSEDEDEELRRALEESLRLHQGDGAGPSAVGTTRHDTDGREREF